jgi:Xaa-Pro aminopeptidase
MRYSQINPNLFIDNRKRFAAQMQPGSCAIFHSNDLMPRNGDAYHNWKQNSDLFYLTGVDQEETVLFLFPDCPNPKFREVLFIRQTNEHIAVWEGKKLNQEEAKEATGVDNVQWYHNYESALHPFVLMSESIYLNLNENDRFNNVAPYNSLLLAKKVKEKYPLHSLLRSAPVLGRLRAIKSEYEIEMMREACNITAKAHQRVLKFLKPGVMEYEIEAEITHEFIKNRATGHAYTPIIASGSNACVLHYIDNNNVCKDGEIVLFDYGAEYGNYCADLSRSLPVNGKFTARQKDVYNAVLRVQKDAMKLLVQGADYTQYHEQVGELMTKELVDLNLLSTNEVNSAPKDKPAYKKYFMHGTSHHIGLDVHDYALKWEPMQINNVFTVEPGIYIPEENLGIRLENDVVIKEDGLEDLMAQIPIEVEEIEEIMNS